MKIKGPYTAFELTNGQWAVLESRGFSIATTRAIDGTFRQCGIFTRRIAAALNRDEARKSTKRWEAEEYAGAFVRLKFDGDEVCSYHDVAKLLNRLGATLPKRRATK